MYHYSHRMGLYFEPVAVIYHPHHPSGNATEKVTYLFDLLQFILMDICNFMAIHPVVVEIFQSGQSGGLAVDSGHTASITENTLDKNIILKAKL